MDNLRERLERGFATLLDLDRRRQETRSPQWGYNTEYLVVARELRQLEADLLRDTGGSTPAPLARWLCNSEPV